MPIIIRELVIRARVEEVESKSRDKSAQSAEGSGARMTEMDIDRIVALCVEKTMTVINRKNER